MSKISSPSLSPLVEEYHRHNGSNPSDEAYWGPVSPRRAAAVGVAVLVEIGRSGVSNCLIVFGRCPGVDQLLAGGNWGDPHTVTAAFGTRVGGVSIATYSVYSGEHQHVELRRATSLRHGPRTGNGVPDV